MNLTHSQLVAAISQSKLSDDELRALNSLIVNELNHRSRQKAAVFVTGDVVTFEAKGRKWKGTVTGRTPKAVKVRAYPINLENDPGRELMTQNWSVAGGFLTKV